MTTAIMIPPCVCNRGDLTATDKLVFGYLNSQEPATNEALARELGITLPTVSAALKRLRQAGLIHTETAKFRHLITTTSETAL